ncbi:MAG: hypothetical protein AAF050_25225, partial [Cyanobacteria bacterium J06649_5]
TFCYPVPRTLFRLRKKRLHKNQLTLNLDLGDVDFSGANMDNFFADSAKKSNVKFVGAELLLAPNCPW